MVVAGLPQVGECAERVEAGEERDGEAIPDGVEPDGRRAWKNANPVITPDRIPVVDPLHVVPHPVTVDEPRARSLRDREHAAVDVLRNAREHLSGWGAETSRPGASHEVVIATDAARRDDDCIRADRELADDVARARLPTLGRAGLEDVTAHAVDHTASERELVHAMAKAERDQAARFRRSDAAYERLEYTGSRPPRDVKARYRVLPSLGPADDWEDSNALRTEPGALLAGRPRDVRFRPASRPEILVAVEAGGAHPVLQRAVVRVPDAEPALLRGVHEKEPAERPERLAA